MPSPSSESAIRADAAERTVVVPGSGNGPPVGPREAPSLADELVEAGWRCAGDQRRLVQLAAAFDDSHGWVADGSPTCAHWIAGALDVEICTAREWLRIGRALRALPLIDQAFAERQLSYSKVRAITRVATPDNESELLGIARRVPAGRLNIALAAWMRGHETPEETDERQHNQRYLSWRLDPDGTVSGSFRLPAHEAGILASAIDAEVMRCPPPSPHVASDTETTAESEAGSSADASAGAARHDAHAEASRGRTVGAARRRYPSFAQQRADALIRLLRDDGAGYGTLTEVVLHVRGDGCTLDNGTPLSESAVGQMIPDAWVRALIHDAEGRPINASGRHRFPTARQRRVVAERDRVCVDCGAAEHLEYDHRPDYRETRRTVIDELELRCADCHRRRHGRDGDHAVPHR